MELIHLSRLILGLSDARISSCEINSNVDKTTILNKSYTISKIVNLV